MKKLLYISALLMFVFAGCKKYPDDDKRFLFKSPMKRIDNGLWQVEKMEIDGVDSTNRLYYGYYQTPAVEYTFKEVKIRFKKANHSSSALSDYHAATVSPAKITGTQSAAWNFTDGKDGLVFFFDSSGNYTNSFQLNTKLQKWSILTLTTEKFEIITTEGKRKIKLTMKAA